MKPRETVMTPSVSMERVRRGAVEIAILLILFAAYYVTRGLAAGKESVAFAHARDVMSLERHVGIFREMSVQGWLMTEPRVIHFLNFVYAYTHMAVLILVGIWMFIRHGKSYPRYRNVFLGLLGAGLLIYITYPLAPPRFFPYSGFVDTLALYSGFNYDQPSLAALYNPFAAMPSLHCAFALYCGIALVRLGRSVIHWILGIFYPLLMVTAVVGTGNHYILDAIAGFTLTILAYLIVPRLVALWNRGSDEEPATAAG